MFGLVAVFAVVWLQWRRRIVAGDRADRGRGAAPSSRTRSTATRRSRARSRCWRCCCLFLTPLPREIGALMIAALAARQPQDHQPHDDRRGRLAAAAAGRLPLRDHRRAQPGRHRRSSCWPFSTITGCCRTVCVLLTLFSVVTSNAIGSLPAAMLLLQIWPNPPPGVLYALALLSTLAGNLLLTGSLTNVLIAERAERMGARLELSRPCPRRRADRGASRSLSPSSGWR